MKKGLVVLVSMFLVTAASAGLIGDDVNGYLMNEWNPGGNSFTQSSASVGSGIEFEYLDEHVEAGYGRTYTYRIMADIADDAITLRLTVDIPYVANIGAHTYYVGWIATLSDLDWGGVPDGIGNVTTMSSTGGMTLLSYGQHSVELYVPAVDFYWGVWGPQYIDQYITVGIQPVPEPATLLLFGLGGLLLRKK